MGLFDIFAGKPDIEGSAHDAFVREQARLKKLRREARIEADFMSTEGEGISEKANVTFGDELDLEDLSDEERLQRSTGRIEPDTGLIL